MLRHISLLAAITLAAATGPSFAQKAQNLGSFGEWGTYGYNTDQGRVCYALTPAKTKKPDDLKHGNIYFFVTQRPGQNVAFEPQFAADYQLKTNSTVTATIGSKSFTLKTEGKIAWLENAAEEPQFVQQMKAGAELAIKAVSGKGNNTAYTFSLSGITAALDSISSCR